MTLKQQMDKIYRELTFDDIPWNTESEPDFIRDLIDSKWIKPCDAVDIGCGVGTYAIWLASIGFRMTGLDLSQIAIELASAQAKQKGVTCKFDVQDMTCLVKEYDNTFDFAYDWEVLHHVFPENREQYITNIHRMLRSGGKYFSLCFSEEEPSSFGGRGKYRKTPLGTTLYFSSERELRDLFETRFVIKDMFTTEVPGKKGPHIAIKAMMLKKDA